MCGHISLFLATCFGDFLSVSLQYGFVTVCDLSDLVMYTDLKLWLSSRKGLLVVIPWSLWIVWFIHFTGCYKVCASCCWLCRSHQKNCKICTRYRLRCSTRCDMLQFVFVQGVSDEVLCCSVYFRGIFHVKWYDVVCTYLGYLRWSIMLQTVCMGYPMWSDVLWSSFFSNISGEVMWCGLHFLVIY